MANWRYILGKTPPPGVDPTLPLERVAWLRKADDKNLNVALNRAGDAGFKYPTKDRWSGYLMAGPNYCLIAERDGVDVWTGPLANHQGQASSSRLGSLSCKAVGWLEMLEYRELQEDVTYGSNNNYIPQGAAWGSGTIAPAGVVVGSGTNWTDADIVRDLLQKVINYNPAYAPPIRWGGAVGTRYTRSKTWTKGTKIGRCFAELTEIEAGIDIRVGPTDRKLYVSSYDTYTDHPEVVWGFNKPPFNVESISWQSDYLAMRNRLKVVGMNNATAIAQEDTSIAAFHMFEETISLPSVAEVDILNGYAWAEIAYKGFPWIFYNFAPKTARARQPRLFEHFQIGDAARLSIDHEPINEDQRSIRLFAASLSITGAGNEKLTSVQTLASGS